MSTPENSTGATRRRRSSSLKGDASVVLPVPKSGLFSKLSNYALNKIYAHGPAVFAFSYGFFCFCVLGARAVVEGCIIKKPGKPFWDELESERHRQWDLSKPPSHDLKHAFFTLDSGAKLHYLTSNLEYVNEVSDNSVRTKTNARPNLVILIHGWPDTCMLWNDVISHLSNPVKNDTTLIAVDLPGFGGSDGLPNYGPDEVINALFEFIVAMRTVYLRQNEDQLNNYDPAQGKVLVVGHDWGALCGFKLAAQAPQLADRFILCNSVLPQLALRNCGERWKTACKLYREWKRDFPAHWLPKKVLTPMRPVLRQIGLSAYVFIFNLPLGFPRVSMSRCNLWSLRLVSSIALGYRGITHTSEVVSHMAGFMGPNARAYDTSTPDGQSCGTTVYKRAHDDISTETIRFYREGLASRPWNRQTDHALLLYHLDMYNSETRKKRMVGTLRVEPAGRLNAPTTIIWGERDPALNATVMLENMDEYLTEHSQVIRLPNVGHWVPLEGEGPSVVATILQWALEEENVETIEGRVQDVCETAKLTLRQ